MARSLTVNHDEKPATNLLFTGFLLLAAAVLMLSALTGYATDSAAASASPSADLQHP